MEYNENFNKLASEYVFHELKRKADLYEKTTGEKVIDLGVGDVKLPLFNCVITEMKTALDEMGKINTFHGYSPPEGYMFLREKISNFYSTQGVNLSPDEIFVTDGAKSFLGDITELFKVGSNVLFITPCYPAGYEANLLRGNNIHFITADKDNNFLPSPPFGRPCDLIYMCSPNNPTGATYSHKQLSAWIDYAISENAIIIFDGAYSSFVSDGFPKTVYEIPRAKKCAIEIRSFSKSLGFTGIRVGFAVIPNELFTLKTMYLRRIGCRFNGVSYVSQRGASAIFNKEGIKEVENRIKYYKTNATAIKYTLSKLGIWYNKTYNSPYIFAKCPNGLSADAFSDLLLNKLGIIATPSSGFLQKSNDFVRFSAFSTRKTVLSACERLSSLVL